MTYAFLLCFMQEGNFAVKFDSEGCGSAQLTFSVHDHFYKVRLAFSLSFPSILIDRLLFVFLLYYGTLGSVSVLPSFNK